MNNFTNHLAIALLVFGVWGFFVCLGLTIRDYQRRRQRPWLRWWWDN